MFRLACHLFVLSLCAYCEDPQGRVASGDCSAHTEHLEAQLLSSESIISNLRAQVEELTRQLGAYQAQVEELTWQLEPGETRKPEECQCPVAPVDCGTLPPTPTNFETKMAPLGCEPGYAQEQIESALGTFNGTADSACEACAPGHFADDYGSTACAPCSSGSIAPFNGSTACQECSRGTFAAHTFDNNSMQWESMQSCEECAPGRHATSWGQTLCEVCTLGTTAAAAGSSACAQCARGTFGVNSLTCAWCAVGRFQNVSGETSCRNCSEVLNPSGHNLHRLSTMALDETGWVHVQGADDPHDCGCREGAWLSLARECLQCGEGMVCEGMGHVELEPGYFASSDNAGFVWRCHGDSARCPGGAPGTCAAHRRNTSIACGECVAGARVTTEGHCEACTSGDVLLLIGVAIAVLGVLCCVYVSVAMDNRAKQKEPVGLIIIMGVQVVTVIQILGVFNMLTIAWPGPFASIVRFASLFKFKMLTLNVGCVASMTALMEYTFTTLGVGGLVLAMVGIHVTYLCIFATRRESGMFQPTLIGAVGTILMVANITITDSILTPFQCEEHPNGMMTLQEYKQVVCWNSEFDPQHKTMVVVALVAVLIPLAFLSLCVWVVVSLPARVRQGDATFLRAFAFLFYRYRSGAYWYAVVLVLRNTCVVTVPIIADEALQLCALVVVLTPCAFLSFAVFPWRVHFANVLDVATNAGFLLTIFLAALSVENVDRNVVGEFLIGIFLVLATLFVAAGTLALHLIFVRRGKPFQYFLCHHKVGGGGFARLLKVLLKVNPSVSRDVFLDADNLQDLALLFEYVANKTETLVVLCTAKIMSRAWCLGEMTTAQLHKVDAILVLFPDFEWPTVEFINNCAEYVDELPLLAEYGINEAMAKDTFKWLQGLPRILLPQQINKACMNAVVARLIGRKGGKHELSLVQGMTTRQSTISEGAFIEHNVTSTPEASTTCEVAALVDHFNQESVCTALLIRELLKAHFPLLDLVPRILGPEDDLTKASKVLLVICSSGCFQQKAFVRQLFQAASVGVGVITVVAEQSFRFPTEDFYSQVREASHVLPDSLDTTADLELIIRKIFEEIAIGVHPQESEDAVKVRVAAIARRLLQNSVKRLVSTCNDNRLLEMLESFQDVDGEHPRLQVQGFNEDEAAEFTLSLDEL